MPGSSTSDCLWSKRIFIGNLALKIVGTLFAAIGNLPCLFVVIGGDGRHRPHVAVARDFSAVIEIVEHAKLQREFVLVGSDVLAVHGERRIAVADFQIAQYLIVGSVFLEHVDDVLDRILPAGEGNGSGVAVKEVVPLDRVRELRKLLQRGRRCSGARLIL